MISESNLWLRPRSPFRLDLTAWCIRRRPENKIDRWNGNTYSRVLAIGNRAAKFSITQQASRLRVQVAVAGGTITPATKTAIVAALERLLGLRVDLNPFYEFSEIDTRLALLAQRFRGLKPPRFPSVFEALVNGIACQQLSLAVGIILLGRLSEAYGAPFDTGTATEHSFPIPRHLAAANASDLRQMGFSSNKARALIELASAIVAGRLDVEGLDSAGDAEAIAYLLNIRGIGRWTAEYALLRGMGRTNIFPGDDVGARNNLARWLKMHGELDYDRVARRLSKWRQYGGLIYFHLLMDSLERTGFVQSGFPHPGPAR